MTATCEPGAEATDPPALREARRIADDVLFPAALAVDAGDPVLGSHLDLLAEKGFYGLAAPEPPATPDLLPGTSFVGRVVEILASGCLTTALVWGQHHSAVMAAARTSNEAIRDTYLAAMASGRCRAGLAGTTARPGPALLRATPVDGGWIFDGLAPWVTGWGMIDIVHAVGRDERDMVVWALLDAMSSDSVSIEPLDMVAVQASRTVLLRFTQHFVPHERVTATLPQATYLEGDAETLRFTGSLTLGVVGRAVSLLGSGAGGLPGELRAVRAMLATADARDVAKARAAGAELALRAAAALTVWGGSRSVLLDAHAQRLVREATFLLVFGSRPGIRRSLLDRLTA
jgi:hypothetical protein